MIKRIFVLAAFTILSGKALADEAGNFAGHPYTLFKPVAANASNLRPLVVVLHGCNQAAQDIASSTGLTEYAGREKFFLLAPEQSLHKNSDLCWNWNWLENQLPNVSGSETRLLQDLVESIKNSNYVDSKRIYVVGLGAGGSEALNLAYAFPDFYDGVLSHSGVPFSLYRDEEDFELMMSQNPNANSDALAQVAYKTTKVSPSRLKLSKVIVVYGGKDSRLNSNHGSLVYDQGRAFFDFADDGKRNDTSEFNVYKRSYTPATRLAYTVYRAYQRGAKVEAFFIPDLGYAWTGGKAGELFTEPNSFNITKYIVKSFDLYDDRDDDGN